MLRQISYLIIGTIVINFSAIAQVQLAPAAARVDDPRSFIVNPSVTAWQATPLLVAGYQLLHTGIPNYHFGNGYIGGAYRFSHDIGLGLSVQSFSGHLLQRQCLDISLGYWFSALKLAAGINFGMIHQGYDRSAFMLDDINDPLLAGSMATTHFNLGFGLIAQPIRSTYVSLSLNHLNQPDISLTETDWKLPIASTFSVACRFGQFQPFFSLETEDNETYYYIGAEQGFLSDQVRLRLQYSPQMLAVASGYQFNNIHIEYSFHHALTELNAITSGSHQLMVGYRLAAAQPDFELAVEVRSPMNLARLTLPSGDSLSLSIRVIPKHNFKQEVQLSLTNVPAELSSLLVPNHISPAQVAELLLTVPTRCPSGSHHLEIVGRSGALEHRVPLAIKITSRGELLAGLSSSADTLIIEREEIHEESPLLNAIFFAENDDQLDQTRYELAPFALAASQLEAMPDVQQQYRALLNLIGQRLQVQPQSRIKLIGYNSNIGLEKGNLDLSRRRAQAVKDFWVKHWGIKPERLAIQAKNRPPMVAAGSELGNAESRRVDIIPLPGSESILEPIMMNYHEERLSQPSCIFSTGGSKIENALQQWQLILSDAQDHVIRSFSGKADLPATITWDWTDDHQQFPLATGLIQYQLRLEDAAGQTAQSGIGKILIQRRQIHQLKPVQKFRLILFEFARDEVDRSSPNLQRQLQEIVEKANQSPNARILLKGYTDVIGTAEFNQQLSEKRAQTIYQQLVKLGIAASRITYQGFGDRFPIMPNDAPEGRMLNRRVEIFIEYPEN